MNYPAINTFLSTIIPKLSNNKLSRTIIHEIKVEKRVWKKYLQLIQFLNINPNAKPVWLFFLTILTCLSSFTSYQFIKLIQLITSKLSPSSNKFLTKHQTVSNSYLNFKKLLTLNSPSSSNTRIINVPYKNKIIKLNIPLPSTDKIERDKLIFKKFMKDNEAQKLNISSSSSSTPSLRFQFLEKLSIIWNTVLIPNLFHKNSYLLLVQILFLIARTWLSLLVTKLDGQITKDLMSFNLKYFLRDIIYWFLFAVPASYINAGIKYLTKRLSLNFRTNLVRYSHDLYMDSKLVYYKLQYNKNQNLDKTFQLNYENFNQYITEDIKTFCDTLTDLFTNVGKPSVDLLLFAFYLRDNIGNLGILGILLNYFFTGMILKNYSPNFSKLWKVKSFFESIYFNYNLNLINNCEEISFYKGINFERFKVKEIFGRLMNQVKLESTLRFKFQLLEDYILKSVWPAFGYFFASLPIMFDSGSTSITSIASNNIKSFTVNKRLILSMADAGSRLMYSIKDISKLSGLTDRVFTLLVNLHQVHDVNFMYGMILDNNIHANSPALAKFKITGGFGSNYNLSSFSSRSKLKSIANSANSQSFELGTIQKNFQGLRFEHINIIPPSIKGPFATPILKNLNFKILNGENLIIHGKNGSGKTSIVRIISELWPLFNSGLLSKPSNNDIFYVSQKQYFVSGSLRDQIIYPLTWKSCLNRGWDDTKLHNILKDVGLDYLIERFGLDYNPHGKGMVVENMVVNDKEVQLIESYVPDNVQGKVNWDNLLSGGEKQKLIFARVLFHNKKLVVLDEPSSAISYDFEDILFDLLKKRGFTLVTISNRESLVKYHDYILRLNNDPDSPSNGVFSKIDEDYLKKFETLDNEIEYLEMEIEKINHMKERKSELIGLLDGYE